MHWLRQSGAEVKRQAEEAGRSVRVMTVHGAKGLQAPVVILPDTTSLPPDGGGLVWADGLPALVAPGGAAVRRGRPPARRRPAGTDGGIQPPALRRADPGGGPAAGVRLADPQRRCRGGELVPVRPAGDARFGQQPNTAWPMSASHGTALPWCTRRRSYTPPRASKPATVRRSIRALAGLGGRPAGLAAACGAHRTIAADARWRQAARPTPGSARCRMPPRPPPEQGGALERGSLIHHVLQHAPALPDGRAGRPRSDAIPPRGGGAAPELVGGDHGHHRPPVPGAAVRPCRPGGTAIAHGVGRTGPSCPASSTAWPCCRAG